MTTNTIPTVRTDSGIVDGDGTTRHRLTVSYTDGVGRDQLITLYLNPEVTGTDLHSLAADDAGEGLVLAIAHSYLMGYEAGAQVHADLDVVRREMVDLYQLGYGDGMQEEMPGIPNYTDNPLGNQMYTAGRNARQENGRLREQLEGVGAQLTQRNHRIEQLEAALQSALASCERTEVEREEWRMAATPEGSDLLDRVRAQESEAALLRNQISEWQERNRNLQTRIEEWEADFDKVSELLVDEARSRDWCSDYDRFVETVNARLTRGSLWTRERSYTATIELQISFTVDHGTDADDMASNIAAAIHRYGDNLGDYAFTINEYSTDNVDESE